LQIFNPFAKVGDGDFFEDFHDGLADFLHDAADAALFLAGTGAAFVEFFADATDGRERAFDETDDFGQSDLVGRKPESVSAGDAAATFEDARGTKVVEDLFQETFRDVLRGGNGLDSHDGIVVIEPQNNQGSKRVMPSLR